MKINFQQVKHLIPLALMTISGSAWTEKAVIPSFAEEQQIKTPFQYGAPGDRQSKLPVVSDDGRYIAFESTAFNLVPNDTNTITDVFVHDAKTAETHIVSVSSEGEIGNDYSGTPSMSADGRYIAFQSIASNLVKDDVPGSWDVFVHDMKTRKTERISVAMDGSPANRRAQKAQISADGNFVVFESNSTNLTEVAPKDGTWQIYIRDRKAGKTELVSVTTEGLIGDYNSELPTVSGDGRFVVFNSPARFADNLKHVEGVEHWDYFDVFIRDRKNKTTNLVSVIPDTPHNTLVPHHKARSRGGVISRDGRHVAFESIYTDFDSNTYKFLNTRRGKTWRIYVRDLEAKEAKLLSQSPTGELANYFARNPSLSADGRYVAFESAATNLVENDLNDNWDVFIWDRMTDKLSLASLFGDKNQQRPHASADGELSADGSFLVFGSNSDVRAPNTQRNREDIYLRDMKTGKSRIVSLATRDDSVANVGQ